MPRIARLIVKGEPTVYHVMSRTALDGFVLGNIEKERDKNFEVTEMDRFRYRTRSFTDSGIIGSKVFVDRTYQ